MAEKNPTRPAVATTAERLTLLNMLWAGDINPDRTASVVARILGTTAADVRRAQRDRDARGAVSLVRIR